MKSNSEIVQFSFHPMSVPFPDMLKLHIKLVFHLFQSLHWAVSAVWWMLWTSPSCKCWGWKEMRSVLETCPLKLPFAFVWLPILPCNGSDPAAGGSFVSLQHSYIRMAWICIDVHFYCREMYSALGCCMRGI